MLDFDLQLFADPPAGDPPPKDTPAGDPPPDPALDGLSAEELAARKSNEKVFERQRNEAKRHRERAEAAEAEREQLKTWKAERERKDLEEQGKWKEAADAADVRARKAEEDRDNANKAKDQETIRERLRVQAIKRGIIDEDLVDTFDLSTLKLQDGRVTGIKEFLDALADSKPVYFAKPGDRTAPLDRPPASNENKPVSAEQLSDKDFAALDARMKSLKA